MAGLFPILHLGRPWFFYWLAPYPNQMGLWPQWRSPLVWDFFAISTYILVSLLFWYIGLIPDLATLRDRAKSRAKQRRLRRVRARLARRGAAVGALRERPICCSPGWPRRWWCRCIRWSRWTSPSAHPGYHSTIFPPYFVAGALFSGFAMVLTLAIPLRRVFGLHDFITARASRQRGQGACWPAGLRRLRLRHRDVRRLLQRRRVRDRDDRRPLERRLRAGLLVDAVLQRRRAAAAVVAALRGAMWHCCSG